jgi:Xaa-Pro aminopeptidase
MLGFEALTMAPIDRNLVDTDLLSPAEAAWLDAYHAKVLERVGPLVPADTRAWLQAQCAPILQS